LTRPGRHRLWPALTFEITGRDELDYDPEEEEEEAATSDIVDVDALQEAGVCRPSPPCASDVRPNKGANQMGADLRLKSIFDPWFADFEARGGLDPAVTDAGDRIARTYTAYESSGGYLRNGYNAGDVMWAIGLSWHTTVLPMLDDKRQLPVDRARELVAMIEERPLTRERVAQHALENMDDDEQHPVMGSVMAMAHHAEEEVTRRPPPPTLPPDIDDLFGFLSRKRAILLALLRKSIELNEPLECSL
jgi:hypothetical protein